MAARPSVLPRWARTTGGVDSTAITAPTSAEQDSGLAAGQKWTAQKANWLLNAVWKWVLYLSDGVFVSASGSVLAGLDATGDGATPGGKFTPGGGGTPARGAVNLSPQVAPTAPSAGDIWYDSSSGALSYKGGSSIAVAPAYGPFSEGFESATFPPVATPGWTAPSGRYPSDLAYARDTGTPLDSTASANRPGGQGASTNSSLGLSVYLPSPTRIAFLFKLICNPASDFLNFYIDGVLTAQFSSRTGPTTESGRFVSDVLTQGAHTFDWRFVRGGLASVGSEQAKVDVVELLPEIWLQSDPTRFYWFDDMLAQMNGPVISPMGMVKADASANASSYSQSSGAPGTDIHVGCFLIQTASIAIGDGGQFGPTGSQDSGLSTFMKASRLPFAEMRVILGSITNCAVFAGLTDGGNFDAPLTSGAQALYDSAVGANWRWQINNAASIDTGIAAATGPKRMAVSIHALGCVLTFDGKCIPGGGANQSMVSSTAIGTGLNVSPRYRIVTRTAAGIQTFSVDWHRLYCLRA